MNRDIGMNHVIAECLKVNRFYKQIFLFSFEPKTERNYQIRDCYFRFDFTQFWEEGWLTFTNSLPWAAGNESFCPFLPIFLSLPQSCHAAI